MMDGLDEAALRIAETVQENLEDAAPDGMFGLLILDSVWVDPAYRGQGVASHAIWRVLKLFEGAAMPDYAVAIARPFDQDAVEDEPEVVEDDEQQERVLTLFERMGFHRVGDSDVVIFPLEKEPRAPSMDTFVVKR
jgi:GNAT superfamily N-acetyltransferase